jgi:hypothetical protein
MSGECCASCDAREAEAREAGRIAPDDVPVTMTELREIWETAEADGRICNGITGAVLRERYGDRLYHVIGVGWFIRRPELQGAS